MDRNTHIAVASLIPGGSSESHRGLWPLAAVYGALIGARNAYYDLIAGAAAHAGIPVISVGNLTVGGTGKTPMVIEIVRRLAEWGRRPAILTRGYKAPPGQIADEVAEFHEELPGVSVMVNADRVAGADVARREHGADCVVLDDGFQHRRLRRDLDIVLIDALNPWGGGWLLPAGRLREPLSSLRRAHLVIVTRCNQVDRSALDAIRAELRRRAPNVPSLASRVEPAAIVHLDGSRQPPAELRGKRVLAVCGLGNPGTFGRLVSELGAASELLPFADHQRYWARDVEAILAAARRADAGLVVTTRKDWGKLVPLWPRSGPPLARLDVRAVIEDDTSGLDARLRQALERRA